MDKHIIISSIMLGKGAEETTGSFLNESGDGISYHQSRHHIVWILVESVLLLCILCGNILTICAVILSRRLARATSSQFVLRYA